MTKDDPQPSTRKPAMKTGGIGKVEAAPIPGERPWVAVFKAFNPLGAIADSYAKTIAYKLECKRLDTELERIKEQAGVIHATIDANHAQQMEVLRQRRVALERFYDTVQGQLSALHVERSKVLEMAQIATERMLSPETPIEEKRLFKEFATETTARLPAFGQNANESLATIVAALPPVDIPRLSLPESE